MQVRTALLGFGLWACAPVEPVQSVEQDGDLVIINTAPGMFDNLSFTLIKIFEVPGDDSSRVFGAQPGTGGVMWVDDEFYFDERLAAPREPCIEITPPIRKKLVAYDRDGETPVPDDYVDYLTSLGFEPQEVAPQYRSRALTGTIEVELRYSTNTSCTDDQSHRFTYTIE